MCYMELDNTRVASFSSLFSSFLEYSLIFYFSSLISAHLVIGATARMSGLCLKLVRKDKKMLSLAAAARPHKNNVLVLVH